jgi:hypothetical protein
VNFILTLGQSGVATMSIEKNREKKKLLEKKNKRRVEKNKEYKNVKHLTVGSKVTTTFNIILKV